MVLLRYIMALMGKLKTSINFSETICENATLYMLETGTAKGGTIAPWKNFVNIVAGDFSDSIEAFATNIDTKSDSKALHSDSWEKLQ